MNPVCDFDFGSNVASENSGNDVTTISGTTVTFANGSTEFSARDILVADADIVIEGDILAGDVFVFIDPDFGMNSVTGFDSSQGDLPVVPPSGFGVDVAEG